jgi:hypothetical protein
VKYFADCILAAAAAIAAAVAAVLVFGFADFMF